MIDGDPTHPLANDLLAVLRSATRTPALELDAPPQRLAGGFWAELIRFRLQGAPPQWQGDLVARVMPDVDVALKETVFQDEVAKQGYPTPIVQLAGGPDDGLGRPFMIMDLAVGASALDGLDGLRAIAVLPRLVRSLPGVLAEAMARLHRLDPAPCALA